MRAEERRYHELRAPEYDDWCLGRNVYKRYFAAEELARELGSGRTLHAGDWFVAVAA